tara:strand:+ start:253 stop:561 length:309 start_codon:yes stop_codon:yes gene_type:complete
MLQVGERFDIECRELVIGVVCLSAGQQSRLLSLLGKIQKAEQDQTVADMGDLFKRALTMCVGDDEQTEKLFEETLDFEMIGEVIQAVTQKNAITVDDKKKQD